MLQAELSLGASYEDWIATLARYFEAHDLVFGHGTDNASDEAFWLVRHMQRWRDEPLESAPDPSLLPALAELAQRRAAERVPMAYLLGEAWFAGLPFNVDPRVLIPRSPMAEIIEAGFVPWCRPRPGDRILDIGTGSGCIAVAAALHCPGVLVDATDVSAEALAVAAANVARHGVADRVRLFQADLFAPVPERYRVIISNPPYVPARELASLPAEYRREPGLALEGGVSGLAITKRILAGAGRFLDPDGVLIVEVGNEAQALAEAYPRLPLTWVEFERGGDGVFVITAEELRAAAVGDRHSYKDR
jgi:ribosomal protein L3 glutamine methyltransferase